MSNCCFSSCDRIAWAKGYCIGHYARQRTGLPMIPLNQGQRRFGTPPRIICDEVNGCHIFRGAKDSSGYGHVAIGSKMVKVHRLAWERENGPIPAGLVIDHICRNRACCNVEHLRLVTRQTNATENSTSEAAINAAKTHCKHGHEFTPSNTIRKKNGRECRTCKQINKRRENQRNRDMSRR